MKKFSVVLAMILVFALAVPTFANPFSDVPSNHWAYEAVNKLVAAGIITGYADGTFKGGNNITRYEVAVVVTRLLDSLEAERAELLAAVEAGESGLSKEEAKDVNAIVVSLMAKNNSGAAVSDSLSDKQAEEVVELVKALTVEFKPELTDLGAKLDVVAADVDALAVRVADLETAKPSVTFSGSYAVDATDQTKDGDVVEDVDYYWFNDPDQYNREDEINVTDTNGDGKVTEDDVTGFKVESKDPIVYTDPWDDDSDEIDADKSSGELEQTLNLQADIVKDGLNATVKIDAHEDSDIDDVVILDAAELALENDSIAVVYNNKNTADLADYAFSGEEFNGVTAKFKNYGVDVFAGINDYDNDEISTEDKDVVFGYSGIDADGDGVADDELTFERSVTKYEFKDGKLVPIRDETTDYYVFGAKKAFDLAGLSVNAKYAGAAGLNKDDVLDENIINHWLGFDTAADLAGADVTFDFGYSMPDSDLKAADSGTLIRFGAAKDLGLAAIEFNYKNRSEDFAPVSEDGVVFDDGDDDYDEFTTGLAVADTTGWNMTVAPKLFEDITTEVFYASIDEDKDEATKLSLTAEMPILMDGLTVNGEYTNVDPIEDATVFADDHDGEVENTMKVGAEYEKDYLTADVSFKSITNVDFYKDDHDKSVTAFGAAITDYPVFGDLTASAGFDYETLGKDYDKKTNEYNLGLGYTLGAAKLSYDFTNKKVDGDVAGPTEAKNGTYNTNKIGLTYTIVEGTDLVASYEVLDLDVADDTADINGADDYTVKTAKAGVEVSF